MKPEKKLLIWLEPAAAVDPCRISAASSVPDKTAFSLVMTVKGEAELKVSRRIREPVTTMVSACFAGAGVAAGAAAGAV